MAGTPSRDFQKQADPSSRSLYRDWRKLRRRILERDGHSCRYCDASATCVDHIVPRTHGGTDNPDNLAAACKSCNSIASNNLFASFEDRKAYIQSCLAGDPDPSSMIYGERRAPNQPLNQLIKKLGFTYCRTDLEALGGELANIVARKNPYSYNYLHGVAFGHMEPSKEMAVAINAKLIFTIDGTHPIIASAQVYKVLGHEENLDQAYVMGSVEICPNCMLRFVPNHPSRKYCPICSPPR